MRQSKNRIDGYTTHQNAVRRDSPSDQLRPGGCASHAVEVDLGLHPGRLSLKVRLHREQRGGQPTFSLTQRGNLCCSNLGQNKQMRSKAAKLPEDLAATPAKNPVGRRGAVILPVPPFVQPSPKPRSVAQHPPVGIYVKPAEPGLRVVDRVEHAHLETAASLLEGARDYRRGANMA